MMTRNSFRGMVFTATSLVLAAGAVAQSGRYEQLWGAFGPNEPQVQTSQVPTIKRHGTVVLYTGQAGIYPKVWQGQNVNGGVPVAADIPSHLAKLQIDINQHIPPDFTGYAVIDYEDWDVLWSQTPEQYRELTRAVVRAQYAGLTPSQVEEYSIRDHELAAKNFLLQTLNAAKAQRPNAKWGYYGYPREEHVPHLTQLQWLWDASTALYPVAYTVYPFSQTSPTPYGYADSAYFPNLMQTLVGTSRQLAGSKPVAAFVWCRYHNLNPLFGLQMMNETDIRRMLREPRLKGADAAIFWDYISNTQQVGEYHSLFSSTLARVSAEIDLEFNPPSSSQSGGAGSPPPAPPLPPPLPPPGNGNTGHGGTTGTYTNTSIPNNSTNTPTAPVDGGDGDGSGANASSNTPAEPGQPSPSEPTPNDAGAGTPPAAPAPPSAGGSPKNPRTVARARTFTRMHVGQMGADGKKIKKRDIDTMVARAKWQERWRRQAESRLAEAANDD